MSRIEHNTGKHNMISVPLKSMRIGSSTAIEIGYSPLLEDSYFYIRKYVESSAFTGYTRNGMNLTRDELKSLAGLLDHVLMQPNLYDYELLPGIGDTGFEFSDFITDNATYIVIRKLKDYGTEANYRTRGLAVPVNTLDVFIDNLEKALELDDATLMRKYKASDEYQHLAGVLRDGTLGLSQREQRLIMLRYGINEEKCSSISRIAFEFDLSVSRVGQLLKNALNKIT